VKKKGINQGPPDSLACRGTEQLNTNWSGVGAAATRRVPLPLGAFGVVAGPEHIRTGGGERRFGTGTGDVLGIMQFVWHAAKTSRGQQIRRGAHITIKVLGMRKTRVKGS